MFKNILFTKLAYYTIEQIIKILQMLVTLEEIIYISPYLFFVVFKNVFFKHLRKVLFFEMEGGYAMSTFAPITLISVPLWPIATICGGG